MADPRYSPTTFTKSKMPFSWPSILNPIPRRYRRRLRSKFRSAQSPASSIASIQTSFNPADSIKALRAHRWSYYDAKYLILIIVSVFSLSISQAPGPLVKTGASALLMLALLMPITRQFFLPVLPIFTWLLFFFNARYVVFVVLLLRRFLGSTDLLQIHSIRIPTSHLGEGAARARKYILWCKH